MRRYSGLFLCLGMLVGCRSRTHHIDLTHSQEWPAVEFADLLHPAILLEQQGRRRNRDALVPVEQGPVIQR